MNTISATPPATTIPSGIPSSSGTVLFSTGFRERMLLFREEQSKDAGTDEEADDTAEQGIEGPLPDSPCHGSREQPRRPNPRSKMRPPMTFDPRGASLHGTGRCRVFEKVEPDEPVATAEAMILKTVNR